MAGNKKKKKPVPNPARGFATTSIAAKPRPEATESDLAAPASASPDKTDAPPSSTEVPKLDGSSTTENPLSAEEFEKQLEESELQLLVEKLASKCKRDAARQRNRLETDRRLLRGQAESVNSLKWFNPDLMGHIQDLISGETRFSVSSLSAESHGAGKMPSEEEMVARLWTLQLTLQSAGFQETRIRSTVKHILDITPSISAPGRDLIWGLEESLDWLARECDVDELPAYENKPKPTSKGETPSDSPIPSRSATPKPGRQPAGRGIEGRERKPQSSVTKSTVVCDSDIEPDELIPEYVATRAKLLELSRNPVADSDDNTIANAKLGAKIQMIENDVLFDKSAAEVQWRAKKIIVEQQLAAARKQMEAERGHSEPTDFHDLDERQEAGINDEAERIAAEILAQGEEMDDLGGLFDSLPQNEVDPNTGKSQTVINGANGMRLVLKDFGKWTGMGPRRILEEACRSRDATVKIQYRIVSDASFASQKALDIWWNKAQELPQPMLTTDVSMDLSQSHFSFTMAGVATPDAKQAEAYIATVALFHIFNSNAREEKVNLRLPPAWRDVWSALAEAKKSHADAADRTVVKDLRSLVRERLDQELEDGVIIQGAFRGRGNAKQQSEATDQNGHRTKQTGNADLLRKIWNDKSNTSKFQSMLTSRMQLPMWGFRSQVLEAVASNQVVIICGETGCGKSTQVPSFLLENELSNGRQCKIYCTEPRRISAISLARRVSEELGENRNDIGTNRSLIGYSIRLEANVSKETKLVYATIGIVMRMLEGSNDLKEVTHLVLDEVHERSIDSDFLLIVLKRLMIQRKDLKVVLMSATVDADRFSAYLGGAPILNVPGRTFPVEVRYLEDAIELTGYTPPKSAGDKMVDLDDDTGEADSDSPRSDVSQSLAAYSPKTRSILYQLDEYQIEFDLIVQLIARIATDGDLQNYSNAILVFLPGIAEIRTLNDMLLGDPRFAKDWLVYPLHSTIATDDQESAFLIPPHGIRKIVLATNIAETGITIPDFCRKNFLSQQTLSNIEDLKGQLLVSLADSGFLPLTDEERKTLSRLRFSGGRGRRQQQFFEIPGRVNMHSDNDVVSASVVAWSFYPKLLVRDTPGMKGMRNIGNNQSISIHPSSVNRGHFDIKWLSYYHIMQSKSVYRAHETTAADPFAIALLCGDVRIDMFSGVIILDGNRGRFAVPDWKTMLAIKVIRTRLRELLTRSFKQPGKLPTAQHEKWLDVWQRLFTQDFNQEKSIGVLSKP
ncbi:ATP dependent RNA helicase [Cordyceps javanica]|uniref:RNA helicase n=1 Tax=Cordyceps javanica TaxID=43265 RepID=A0A545UWP6_9HYPO|nr:ATP dependent RNA helicase [Cordyceps javanica]